MLISGTTGIDLAGLPINNSGNTEVEGNLNITGTGARITGDFSNATHSNRVAFQTNVTNGNTGIWAMPNGTATGAIFGVSNSSDINNASTGYLYATATEVRLNSYANGTGTQLPLLFFTNGGERMRIDTTGNVLLTSGTGALGYGIGSGGTVTQLTSKSTAVTLNKPTGQITMNNAALAAGATIYFLLNNTLITADDVIITTIKDGTGADVRLYRVEAISQGSSFSWIKVTNTHSSSLSESIVIKYAIIKGANS